MRKVTHVVVHTAAAANAQGQPIYQTAETVDEYHRLHNNWRRIGYHSYIERDGRERRDICRPDAEVGAHVGGWNEETLGVCVAGHGDYADFLPAQRKVLIDRCVAWCRLYALPASAVIGHREAPVPVDKTCPGTKVSMVAIRGDIQRQLEAGAVPLEARVEHIERYLDLKFPGWRP